MATVNASAEIDWTQCELIEQVPGKVSGRPIARGNADITRCHCRLFRRGRYAG